MQEKKTKKNKQDCLNINKKKMTKDTHNNSWSFSFLHLTSFFF